MKINKRDSYKELLHMMVLTSKNKKGPSSDSGGKIPEPA